MIKFYENLNHDYTVTIALKEAQIWLRNATTAELIEWASQLKLEEKPLQEIINFLKWFYSDEKPFQHPVYWAAFCVIGQ